jgi:hypothetical protein
MTSPFRVIRALVKVYMYHVALVRVAFHTLGNENNMFTTE